MLKILDPNQLEKLLTPEGYIYKPIKEINVGDRVLWLDQDAEVIAVNLKKDGDYVTVIDPFSIGEKEFKYEKGDELLIKQREYH